MKSLKIVLGTLAVTVGIVVLSSFAVTNYDSKAFAKVCFEYVGPTPGAPSAADLRNDDLWDPIAEGAINSVCINDNTLCVICFENTTTSFFQAREVLIQYLAASPSNTIAALADPQTLNGTGTLAGKSVTVYQKQ